MNSAWLFSESRKGGKKWKKIRLALKKYGRDLTMKKSKKYRSLIDIVANVRVEGKYFLRKTNKKSCQILYQTHYNLLSYRFYLFYQYFLRTTLATFFVDTYKLGYIIRDQIKLKNQFAQWFFLDTKVKKLSVEDHGSFIVSLFLFKKWTLRCCIFWRLSTFAW